MLTTTTALTSTVPTTTAILDAAALADSGGGYRIISHVWGPTVTATPITTTPGGRVRMVPISTPSKLAKALRLRAERPTWMDVIDLDQSDADEVAAAMGCMAQLYRNADVTAVLLPAADLRAVAADRDDLVAAAAMLLAASLATGRYQWAHQSVPGSALTVAARWMLDGVQSRAARGKTVYDTRVWTLMEKVSSRRLVYMRDEDEDGDGRSDSDVALSASDRVILKLAAQRCLARPTLREGPEVQWSGLFSNLRSMLASRFPRETAEMLDGGAVTEAQVTAAIRLGVLKEIAERECSYEIDRAYVAAANLTPKGYISDFTLPEKEALQMVARKLAALGVVPPAVGQYWYDDQDDERSISTRGLYKMLLSPELFETPTAMMLVKHMCVPIDDADHRDTPAPASVAEMQDADPAIESVGVYGQPQQLNNAVFNKLQVTAQGTVVFSGLFTREKMVLFAAVIPVLINLIERLKGSPKFHRRHKLMTYELQWEKAMEHVFQLIVLLGRDFCRWNKEKTFSFWLFFLIADHLRLEGIDRSSRETGKPRLLGEAYMRTKSWQWVDADAEWWRAALFEALVELQTRVAQNKDRINAMIRKFDESSDAAKAPTTVGSRCHLYEQLQRNAVMTVIVGRPVADAFGDFDDSYVIGLTTNSLPMEPGDYLVVDAAGWCLASTDRSKVYTSTSQFAAACFNYNSSNVGYSELGIDRKSSMRTTWRVKCAVPETGSEEGSGGKRDLQALLESIAK